MTDGCGAGYGEAAMLQFTIRELILILAVVGLICGWAIDHDRLARLNNELQSTMREHGLPTPNDLEW
jgi:hypothetical protein